MLDLVFASQIIYCLPNIFMLQRIITTASFVNTDNMITLTT